MKKLLLITALSLLIPNTFAHAIPYKEVVETIENFLGSDSRAYAGQEYLTPTTFVECFVTVERLSNIYIGVKLHNRKYPF